MNLVLKSANMLSWKAILLVVASINVVTAQNFSFTGVGIEDESQYEEFLNQLFSSLAESTEKYNTNGRSTEVPEVDCFVVETAKNDRIFSISSENVSALCEDSFQVIPYVEHIQITSANLEDVMPQAFSSLIYLRGIDLGNNELERIRNNVFSNLRIAELKLNNNKIEVIEGEAFNNMPHLRRIDLTNNRITKIKKNWFYNSPSLVTLLFANNQIKIFQKKALKHIRSQPELKVDLSNNEIHTIQAKAFANLEEYGEIDLSNNKLEYLPPTMFGYTTIGKFYLVLNGNKFRNIEQPIFNKVFMNCQRVLLSDNPLKCSCLEKIYAFNEKRGNELIAQNIRICSEED